MIHNADKTREQHIQERAELRQWHANSEAADINGNSVEETALLTQFAIDHSPDAAFWMGSDARFFYVNESACRSLGYAREELLAMTVHDIDPNLPAEAWPEYWQWIRRGIPLTFESCHRTKAGHLLPVEITINCPEFKGKEYTCVFARNITERKRAEEERKRMEDQLRQSQRQEAIATLAAGIVHDFNNILTAIIGYTELAACGIPPTSPTWTNLQEVLTASKRAKELVRQILTFCRASNQERQAVHIPQLIQETVALLRASLPSTIDIRQQIAHDAGTVLANPTQIHQVLMNLCTNAEHAMRFTRGELEIRVDNVDVDETFTTHCRALQQGPHVRVTIRDTGHGMTPEVMERIFDPFFTTKEVGEGTGMGLAMVHGIVTSHGGAIALQSIPGEGTTFEVYLPQLKQTADGVVRPDASITRGHGRILFVDNAEVVARPPFRLQPGHEHLNSPSTAYRK